MAVFYFALRYGFGDESYGVRLGSRLANRDCKPMASVWVRFDSTGNISFKFVSGGQICRSVSDSVFGGSDGISRVVPVYL